ncbi:unnamed protein product [Caenorhabditis auriculariae]|uniref:non-specific serine/threonine protein kinase n=1 Tax=Caenorhabditis auriculariae TaxID=2777116 RepID=A0A8S1H7A6_9PELO|nr:unnamed protein product [Caenorhabditis auriculariae]
MEGSDEIAEQGFDYSIESSSMKQGAEARLFRCVYLGRPAILKERFEKSYRHTLLDGKLNKARTRSELKGICRARELLVETPTIFFVDGEKNKIIMELVEGPTAKDWIESRRAEDSFEKVVHEFGRLLGGCIARLHSGGLVHGDLTTSNVLLRDGSSDRPVFIDFGLSSQKNVTPEEKGVDLYVLERAIASTHVDCEHMMKGILEGYRAADQKQSGAVTKKLDEIRLRGRKRDMVG